MIKVLLMNCEPNYYDNLDKKVVHEVIPPIGVMYLAAYAKQRFGDDIEVRIMDLAFEKLTAEYLDAYHPSIIGLRALNSTERYMTAAVDFIKQYDEAITVVVGGPYMSADFAAAMRDRNIDYGVVAEGEYAFAEITARVAAGEPIRDIDNLVLYDEEQGGGVVKKISRIDDLDALPFPDYNLIATEKYAEIPGRTKTKRAQGILVSSRGCPYRCIYCHNIMGKKVRLRSAENLFAELQQLYEEHGLRDFTVVDDIFNIDVKRALRFYELVIQWGKKIQIYHHVGFRADIATEDLLDAAAAAGVVMINYGLESAVPRIQELIRKNLNLEKFERILHYSCEKNIMSGIFAMGGFPTETFEEVCATIEFMARFKKLTIPIFSIVNYHPGTELFDLAAQHGFDGDKLRRDYESGYYKTAVGTPTISLKQFVTLQTKYIREVLFDRERMLNAEKIMRCHMTEREVCDFYETFLGKKVTDVHKDVYDFYAPVRLHAKEQG